MNHSIVIYRDGKLVKIYRGMAGYGANVSKSQRMGTKVNIIMT